MKILLLALCCLISSVAHADERSEARQTCAVFKNSSLAQQRKTARQSGYTREQVLKACRDYFRPAPSAPDYDRIPRREEPRRCSGSVQCHTSQQCINRECVDPQRTPCSERGRDQCPAGERCDDGKCVR
ncbi:MAG: hypothetical protein EOP11_19105 [Proteobacteria bacterium]|nr:MAG: hypothetical protein EOP11_19105 [Pseudomonadota bacterium]